MSSRYLPGVMPSIFLNLRMKLETFVYPTQRMISLIGKSVSESIQFMGKFGKDHGVTLAMENLLRTCLGNCADEIRALVTIECQNS